MKESLVKLRQYLLSGVSFAIPFIACGGIMIATAIAINSHYAPNAPSSDFTKAPPHLAAVIKFLLTVGGTSFDLMPVVLSGYIANAIAGKPALVAGFVGGWLATHIPDPVVAGKFVSAGFLGALVSGLVAGFLVMWFKKLKVPKFIRPIMPILIIPIVSASIVALVMLYVVGMPIAHSFDHLRNWLESMGKGNQVLLAIILGSMIAFDMGGPINKTAFFFGSAMIAQGNYTVMGAVAAAICTPPIGLGLATMISRKLWTEAEREAGVAAFAMGFVGITEGAIPFAASDPLRVIPSIMIGSSVSAVIAMLGGVGDHAPHGGPIVLLVVDHPAMYLIAICVGVVVTALTVNIVKALSNGSDAEVEQQAAVLNV
jgi:fructose-specific phosphotransferase system IIC component